MKTPFFSVIIPTYNSASYILNTINSVLTQTFKNFELIIVDDGSTDNTMDIILSINDQRIIYKKIENFGGPSKPRNIGIGLAKSDWICFLDSDDTFFPNKLEICYKNINDKIDLIYHDMKIVGSYFLPNYLSSIKARQLKEPVLKDLLLKGNCITNSSVVVRKKILNRVGNINESKNMIASEDFNTWLKISTISQNFLHIPELLGEYLEHNNGISKSDCYNPYKSSTFEFVKLLNDKEKKIYNLNLERLKIKNKIINGSIKFFNKELIKFLIRGDVSFFVKFKSILMIIIVSKNKFLKK